MRVIIIGATAAGTTAAAKARRLMKEGEIIFYEKGKHTSFGACGLPFFVGKFFDDPNEMIARTPEQFEKSGIQVKLEHEVIAVNSEKKSVTVRDLKTGEEFVDQYDKLLIATGAQPALPPFAKELPIGTFMLRNYEDGLILREAMSNPTIKNVVIIGAGFIGLEVAEAGHKLGKKVTVVEMKDRVMSESFDIEMTMLMHEELIKHGVELKLGCRVEGFDGSPVKAIRTDQGNIACDMVVLSAGVKPATAFLKDTGLKFYSNGAIVANNKGQTNLTDIYAAGDCATVEHLLKKEPAYIPLATVANKLGRIAGENIAGMNSVLPPMLGAASLKVMDMEAARVGLGEEEAKAEGYEVSTVCITDPDHTSYYPPRYDLHIKLIYEKSSKVLLGGQIVGQMGAALRAHALSVAIMKKVTTSELGLMDLGYSPAFTRTWDTLNVAGNVAK
ncbi:MAG: CoA-disulfide reductase [Spirochaetia bacterium]